MQNILTSQPCVYTLMQTRLSANQSARTILIIFIKFVILIVNDREREEDGPGKYSPIFYFRSPGLKNGRQEKYGDAALFMK